MIGFEPSATKPKKECEEELRDKGRLIDRLQLKTTQIATLLQNLEAAKTFDLPSPCTGIGSSSGFPFGFSSGVTRPQNFDSPIPIGHNSSLHQMRSTKKSPFTPTPTGHGQFPSPGGNPGKSRIKPIPSFEEIQKQKQQRLQEETEEKVANVED